MEVCKKILGSCSGDHRTCDPVIVNALMSLCTVLHDHVNALTVDDERRQIGEILCNVVRRVDYGRDFEQQLSFYVEARGAFSNIDSVLYQLVQVMDILKTESSDFNFKNVLVCLHVGDENEANCQGAPHQKNGGFCESLCCVLLHNNSRDGFGEGEARFVRVIRKGRTVQSVFRPRYFNLTCKYLQLKLVLQLMRV